MPEYTVIRTGFRTTVVLRFEDRAEVTLSSATKVGLSEMRKKDKVATAKLGLKYGTIHAAVETTEGDNDFEVATPVATLSVRGCAADITHYGITTDVNVTDQFWTMRAGRRRMLLRQGQQSNNNMPLPVVIRQGKSNVRMSQKGMSSGEQWSLLNFGSGQGLMTLGGSDHKSGMSDVKIPVEQSHGSLPPTPPPPTPPDSMRTDRN